MKLHNTVFAAIMSLAVLCDSGSDANAFQTGVLDVERVSVAPDNAHAEGVVRAESGPWSESKTLSDSGASVAELWEDEDDEAHVLDRGGFSYARSDSGSSVSPRDSGLVTSLHFAETRCGGVLDIECQPTAGHSCLAFASAGLDAIGSFITESMENLPGTDLKATIYTTTTFWVDMDGDWDSLDSNTGAIVVTPSVELTITHTGNGLFAISGMIRNDDEDDSHGWVPYNNTYDAKDPTSIFQITTSVDKTWDVDANGGKSIGFLQWSYMSIGATIEAEVGQPKPLPTEIEFSFDATTTVNNLTIDE